MSQTQKSKSKPTTQEALKQAPVVKGDDLKKKMDALLDEIDKVLEENAEEVVASYVQRGGQ